MKEDWALKVAYQFTIRAQVVSKLVAYKKSVSESKVSFHAAKDFCQIKLFKSIVRENSNICLVGVLKGK